MSTIIRVRDYTLLSILLCFALSEPTTHAAPKLKVPSSLLKKIETSILKPFIPPQKYIDGIYQKDSPEYQTSLRNDRVQVGVIDSGVDYNHPKLAYKLNGNSAHNPTELKFDHAPLSQFFMGHGTSVASLAARESNDIEIVSIDIYSPAVYETIREAYKKGVRIFNFSAGFIASGPLNKSIAKRRPSFIDATEKWTKLLRDCPDALFVVAAGNESENLDDSIGIPAKLSKQFPNIITVGATKQPAHNLTGSTEPELADFSNFGRESVQLAAHGQNVDVLERYGKRGKASGTSFSAPIVANVAAKIKGINPDLSIPDIIHILKITVKKHPQFVDQLEWGGELDEERALELARKSVTNRELIYPKDLDSSETRIPLQSTRNYYLARKFAGNASYALGATAYLYGLVNHFDGLETLVDNIDTFKALTHCYLAGTCGGVCRKGSNQVIDRMRKLQIHLKEFGKLDRSQNRESSISSSQK